MKNIHDSVIDIEGIQVGHAQNLEAMTGCTVVICKKGAIGGVDQRGGAPGTRETDLLRPIWSQKSTPLSCAAVLPMG
jgi:L-aminopeptidase/D-esterase-like protein